MIKFRSMAELYTDTRETARRFPWTLACAVIGTAAMVVYIQYPHDVQKDMWRSIHVAMICSLGLTGFMSLRVFNQTHAWRSSKEQLFNLGYLLILVVYFFLLPQDMRYLDLNRYWLINANLHLLVAIAPFLFLSDCTNAFWQYNKELFIRFVLAFIYSNTIYIGIAIALGVTDHLFVFIKWNSDVYGQLWFLVVGVFNTWFFLKGVPSDILGLQQRTDYPRGLRIFTQFVLIPLVVLYLCILYLYMGKIIGSWSLPHGWLSSFILGVSIMGIVTLLLVHPLKDSEEYGWIRIYSKYFYLALFPLIVLMAVAIGVRIADYGITEQRYFVLVFTLWLLLLAVRFSLKPKTDIRAIPLTLFVLVAVATWGPWSAMSIAKREQTRRLKEFLVNNGLMKDGHVVKATATLDYKISGEISNIAAYLEQSFGLKHLEKWAPPEETVFWDKLSASDFVTKYLGLDYSSNYYGGLFSRSYMPESTYFNLSTKQEPLKRVSGYDYYGNFYLYGLQNKGQPATMKLTTDKGELTLSYNSSNGELRAEFQGRSFLFVTMSQEWLSEKKRQYGINNYSLAEDALSYSVQQEGFRAAIYITNINGQMDKEENASPTVTNVTGNILFSLGPLTSLP